MQARPSRQGASNNRQAVAFGPRIAYLAAMSVNRAKPVNAEKVRRFWKQAGTAPHAGGWAVTLDGRVAHTPGGAPLALPTEAAAALVAAEWEAQGEVLEPASMPATRLAHTALDHVPAARQGVAAEIARYAGSDLLCYREAQAGALAALQAERWQPLLAWAADELDLALTCTAGVIHHPQPEGTVEKAWGLAAALDDFALTGLAAATSLFGSAVLAFALQRGRLGGAEAFDLSRLDETFQEERWGVDAEAAERTAAMRAEASVLERWFVAI